LQLAKKTNS